VFILGGLYFGVTNSTAHVVFGFVLAWVVFVPKVGPGELLRFCTIVLSVISEVPEVVSRRMELWRQYGTTEEVEKVEKMEVKND
jgi:hypothetical protein